MKNTLLIAACAASFSAYALPTYEPFTEYSSLVTANSTNAIDLCTSGLTLSSGDSWGSLNYSGLGLTAAGSVGLDVMVTNLAANGGSSPFTTTALSSLLPSTFPGYPVGAINVAVINPAQPGAAANTVGNSAVLIFASDYTRPASGTKSLYVSYLVSFAQKGQLGAGNDGRYMAFLASSNLVEPSTAYPFWGNLFNTYAGSPRYASHGLLDISTTSAYLAPCDCSAGKDFSTSLFTAPMGVQGGASGAPVFVVGEYTFKANGADTNSVWVNPSIASFGGTTPPGSPQNDVMPAGYNMSDLGGLCLLDRIGSGGLGGVGTNYVANLIVGTTWSYVTGGPEFISQPPTNVYVLDYGNTVNVGGAAVAAGQGVTYQWQKVTASTTNNLTDTTGSAGGAAVVSGSGSTNLALTGVSAGDMGTYQLLTTANGTGYTLTSVQSILTYVTDPFINPQPQPVTVNEGATASFSASAETAGSSMTYQWYNGATPVVNGTQTDGSTISGASGAVSGASLSTTLTLSGVTYQERGNYILWVTNSANAAVSSALVALNVNDPYILTQPIAAVTNTVGSSSAVLVAAAGSGTLSCQWYSVASGQLSNSGDISGVGTSNLAFSNLQLSDAGTYYAIVTGPGGSVQSSNVVISVLPIVTEPPSIVVVPTGATTNITVGTAGAGVTYQWYSTASGQLYNTGDFSGVTTSNLTITSAAYTDSGVYYVIASWANGAEASSTVSVFIEVTTNGPFSPSNWPPTTAISSQVDYGIFDTGSATDTPNFVAPAGWNNVVTLGTGADQAFSTGNTYNGLQGDAATATYLNFADPNWKRFASFPVIDVLLEVYGNSDMYNNTNGGLPTTWTEGQLWQGPYYAHYGTFPLGANNGQWNWILLEVTNPVDSTVDASPYVVPGDHIVGDPGNPPQTSSAGTDGGVNSGTLRLEGFADGFTVRTVALGPQGAFGTTNEINRFAPPANCAPEPTNNLAWVDFNQGTANNLTVNNNPAVDETYQVVSGAGPGGDQRTGIQATTPYMEFPILNDYLGLPCNENLSMQLCIEFYDDPALAGQQFGPYAYATDPYGDYGFVPGYPDNFNQYFYTMTGSGQWLKVDWFVGPANLEGLNTAPLTGGPLVYFIGAAPVIDRIELGVIRTGTNALAGQIPDPTYNIDPFICNTNNNTNGYYAEWNPSAGIINNVGPFTGFSTTLAGPPNDQRVCEAPSPVGSSSGGYYEGFSLLNNVFGPALQDNADVAMILTYYDDPALAGTLFEVNAYSTMTDDNLGTVSPPSGTDAITLQGSGQWKDVSFEIPNVSLQASGSFNVCRYYSGGLIYISRVRYDAIRPCGSYEGIDYLQGLGITKTNSGAALNWRGTATVLGSPVVNGVYTNFVTVTNDVTNNYPVSAAIPTEFFKLQFPSYPTNLSPYTPTP